MTKAMRTGGECEPSMFFQLFDTALEPDAREWQLLGYGFKFHRTGRCIAAVNWVDNNIILASIVDKWCFIMAKTMDVLKDRYGWIGKASPIEVLPVRIGWPDSAFLIAGGDGLLKYC